MKSFLLRLAVALAVMVGVTVLQAAAQQPANDSRQPTAAQQQNDMPSAQDAKPFSGTIVKEKGKLVLKDTAANVSYQLDDQEKAKQFEGKQVKVTGKLDMNTNVIHIESIEAAS